MSFEPGCCDRKWAELLAIHEGNREAAVADLDQWIRLHFWSIVGTEEAFQLEQAEPSGVVTLPVQNVEEEAPVTPMPIQDVEEEAPVTPMPIQDVETHPVTPMPIQVETHPVTPMPIQDVEPSEPRPSLKRKQD